MSKGMDDKDRRSRMANSTVNAPAKKDGAGGSYTWGSAGDIVDYEPVGLGGMTKVTTAPAEDSAPTPNGVDERPEVKDPKQFPALSTVSATPSLATTAWGPAIRAKPTVVQTPPVYVASQPSQRTLVATVSATSTGAASAHPVTVTITEEEWQLLQDRRKSLKASAATAESVPAVQPAPAVVAAETAPVAQATAAVPVNVQEAMRTGVTFDAQHPRHVFARKPHTVEAAVKQEIIAQPSIDWSGSGNLAFRTEVIHAAAHNPAHLSVHAAPRPAPTLQDLKARPSPAAYIPSKQPIMSSGPKFGKPQVIMQRKC